MSVITNTFCKPASVRPANTNEAQLYATPAATEFSGNLRVCNQDTVMRTFRVAHCSAAHGDVAADGDDWLCYDQQLWPGDPPFDISIAMGPTETIRIKASVADKLSFVLEGQKKVLS
jgi:hypothetical protein